MKQEKPYVAPFIRRVMPTASEAEILDASENLRDFLYALYDMFLEQETRKGHADSRENEPNGRFGRMGETSPPRMTNYLAYIRVSTQKQGQTGSSLQEQRDAIRVFADRHGLRIADWYEDRETAAKKGRTQFMRMMAALEKGKAAGVILHKIDRGARNLWDWARLLDLIDRGVAVHFAHDNLDLNSRGGRLAADIQAVVAADYVRNLRDEVRKGIQGRLKQGLYPRQAPVGYLDQGKAKPKTIDPVKGPLVRAAFELYATKGHSFETLVHELHRRGLRRSSGKPLSYCGIATILRNPFYIGIIRVKKTGETFQGVHEPLVSAKTFQLVQAIIDGRDNHKVRRFDFSYKRLLRCGECGSTLTGERQKGHVYYRCHLRGCSTTGIREEDVGAALQGTFQALGFDSEEWDAMVPYLEQKDGALRQARETLVAAYRLQVSALEQREQRLTDSYLDETLDRETYLLRRSKLLVELAAVRENLARAERDAGTGALRVKRFFELVKALVSGPTSDFLVDYRRIVETLTSNRTLIGKDLCVTLRSPFLEAFNGVALLSGAPDRRNFRTCSTQSTPAMKMPVHLEGTIHQERVRILFEHLKDWHPPDNLLLDDAPARRPPPQWFKRKEPPTESHPS